MMIGQNFREARVPDIPAFISARSHRRYGLASLVPAVDKAWRLLTQSAYSQDLSVQVRGRRGEGRDCGVCNVRCVLLCMLCMMCCVLCYDTARVVGEGTVLYADTSKSQYCTEH